MHKADNFTTILDCCH